MDVTHQVKVEKNFFDQFLKQNAKKLTFRKLLELEFSKDDLIIPSFAFQLVRTNTQIVMI